MNVEEVFYENRNDPERPRAQWIDKDFFIITSGRWREFGWCCGHLNFTWRYSKFLLNTVQAAAVRCKIAGAI